MVLFPSYQWPQKTKSQIQYPQLCKESIVFWLKISKRKDNSLHNQGMKVFVYSMKQAQEKNIGWSKTVSAEYFSNNILRVYYRSNSY